MPFAPVKSDPWKRGLAAKRKRLSLWTSEQWGRLCKQAKSDMGTFDPDKYPLSDACVRLIVEFNRGD